MEGVRSRLEGHSKACYQVTALSLVDSGQTLGPPSCVSPSGTRAAVLGLCKCAWSRGKSCMLEKPAAGKAVHIAATLPHRHRAARHRRTPEKLRTPTPTPRCHRAHATLQNQQYDHLIDP